MGPSPGWVQAGSVAAPGGGLQAMLSYLKELTCLVFEGKKNLLIEVKEELLPAFPGMCLGGRRATLPPRGRSFLNTSVRSCSRCHSPRGLSPQPRGLHAHLMVMEMHVQVDASRGREASKSWNAPESPRCPQCHGEPALHSQSRKPDGDDFSTNGQTELNFI